MKWSFWSVNKNDLTTFDNIQKIATSQGDDYATGCFLDSIYFRKYYKIIVIDLSRQQTLDADPKAIKEINFTDNLGWQATILSLLKNRKKLF